MNVSSGITWTGSIYTDSLGAGVFAMPLRVAPGSVQILVDGVDRTSDVAIALGAPLVIELAGIGLYSDTVHIELSYRVTADPAPS